MRCAHPQPRLEIFVDIANRNAAHGALTSNACNASNAFIVLQWDQLTKSGLRAPVHSIAANSRQLVPRSSNRTRVTALGATLSFCGIAGGNSSESCPHV